MKKNILKKVGVGVAMAGLMLLPLLTLAQATGPGGGVPGTLITSPSDITFLVGKVLGWVGGIVLTIALIMLLYSAILYLTAGGAEDRVTRAKNYLIYAIVGIVVAVLAYSVRPFIETFFRGGF